MAPSATPVRILEPGQGLANLVPGLGGHIDLDFMTRVARKLDLTIRGNPDHERQRRASAMVSS
jgi:hypothetical protein